MTTDAYDITFADGFVTPGRRKNNWLGSNTPTTAHGSNFRFEVGSEWVFGSNIWVCTDATSGSAVWTQIDGTGSGSGFANPMTSVGDVIRGGTAGAAVRGADSIFDVTAFGATGDGVTSDTSAISSAISAMTTAGGGVLYFPRGRYVTSGGFTISVPCTVRGDGIGAIDLSETGSRIDCTSATAVLFTVTADFVRFEQLSLVNTHGTPTAGSAIYVNGSYLSQKVDYDSIEVVSFYDNLDIAVGASWRMSGCYISAAQRYKVRIRNTVNADAGDWTIIGCEFASADTAALRIESSGGGKVIGNKFNGGTTPISVAGSGVTSILLISGNSIENYSGDGINVSGSWPYINITGNQFGQYSNGTGNAIDISNTSDVIVANNHFVANTGTPTAVVLSTVTRSLWGAYTNNGFATVLSGTPTYDVSQDAVGVSPASTVESETTFGLSASVGTDTEYARQDHTHGTPADPGSPPFTFPDYPFHDEVLTDGSSNIIYAGGDVVMVTGVPN